MTWRQQQRRQTDIIKNVYAMTIVCSLSRADQSNTDGNTAENIIRRENTTWCQIHMFKTAEKNLINENQPVCQILTLSHKRICGCSAYDSVISAEILIRLKQTQTSMRGNSQRDLRRLGRERPRPEFTKHHHVFERQINPQR